MQVQAPVPCCFTSAPSQGWVALHSGRLMRTEGLRKADARSVHAGGYEGHATWGCSPSLWCDTCEHCCLAHIPCYVSYMTTMSHAWWCKWSLCFRLMRSRPKGLQGLQSHGHLMVGCNYRCQS